MSDSVDVANGVLNDRRTGNGSGFRSKNARAETDRQKSEGAEIIHLLWSKPAFRPDEDCHAAGFFAADGITQRPAGLTLIKKQPQVSLARFIHGRIQGTGLTQLGDDGPAALFGRLKQDMRPAMGFFLLGVIVGLVI